MKLLRYREADALYFRLLERDFEYRVVRLTDDVGLDFATGEKLVGIEVLGASRLFEKPETASIELKERIDLKKLDPAIRGPFREGT
jgi:uncharacterized protein YuzE